MVLYISETAECRRLARNVIPADFQDTDIQSYQIKEFSYIATLTDKDDWALTDREFGALQLVETTLVAADILMHYGDVNDYQKGMAMKDSAYQRLESVVENIDTPVEEGIEPEVDRTEFKSWNKNPAVPPPDRLTNVQDFEESF
jgi:hypothetical protein